MFPTGKIAVFGGINGCQKRMCIDWLRHVLTRGFGAQIQMLWQTPKNRPIVTVRHLKFADFQVVGSEFLKVVFSLIKILTI